MLKNKLIFLLLSLFLLQNQVSAGILSCSVCITTCCAALGIIQGPLCIAECTATVCLIPCLFVPGPI